MDPDSGQEIFGSGSHVPHDFGFHLICRLGSLVDSSIYHANHIRIPGNNALQEVFSSVAKFTEALFLWLSTGSSSRSPICSNYPKPKHQNVSSTQLKHIMCNAEKNAGLEFGHGFKLENTTAVFAKIAASTIRLFCKEFGQLPSSNVLSLATAIVPPVENLSSKVLAIPLENCNEQMNRCMDQEPRINTCKGCSDLSFSKISWIRETVEPKTGIKFPMFLRNQLAGEDDVHQITEVLVATGSRSMRIVKIKSVKLYAFGVYVHPGSICEKLSSKYASIPVNELKDRADLFEDLLREDINMTLRLVVSCKGVKISAVKDAFEKSLHSRLQRVNPNADYRSLSAFGSYFTRDIPLPVGTTIDFRKTADGQFITEIEGRHIGAVRCRDLCRAFFDMYIGEGPVSAQAKQDVAENVAGLITRC